MSYSDLRIFQMTTMLVADIVNATRTFTDSEGCTVAAQLRSTSESIPGFIRQILECENVKDGSPHLDGALNALAETGYFLEMAVSQECLDSDDASQLIHRIEASKSSLISFIQSVKRFTED